MITLQCGTKSMDIHEPLIYDGEHHLGCWIVGRGDLFDLGFRVEELDQHGLEVRVGHTVVLVCKPEGPRRAKVDGQEQARTPADQATR